MVCGCVRARRGLAKKMIIILALSSYFDRTSGNESISRKLLPTSSLYALYSGRWRPACRNNQTGVFSTSSPRAALIIKSFFGRSGVEYESLRLNSPKSKEIEADKDLWENLGFGTIKPNAGVNAKTATQKRMVDWFSKWFQFVLNYEQVTLGGRGF